MEASGSRDWEKDRSTAINDWMTRNTSTGDGVGYLDSFHSTPFQFE